MGNNNVKSLFFLFYCISVSFCYNDSVILIKNRGVGQIYFKAGIPNNKY